jgi:hypothetical protein
LYAGRIGTQLPCGLNPITATSFEKPDDAFTSSYRPGLADLRRTVGVPVHDDNVTDEQPGSGDLRVFDRLLAAGLTLERIEEHLAAGRVRVDGELVTDPDRPAPPPARVVLYAE